MSLAPNLFDRVARNLQKLPVWRSLQAAFRAVNRSDRLFPYGKNYLLYRLHEPLTIVVLGMHRSGTSFITRAINLLGARVGDHLLGEKETNPAGFWEHKYPLRINRNLLEMSGGRWDDPPNDVEVGLVSKLEVKLFLAKLHGGRETTAVWKDPRTLLTFPVWRREMVNYVPVFIFRHPAAVASSVQRRNGFPREKSLTLWSKYNRRLLEIDDHEEVSYFVEFDGGIDHVSTVLQNISNEVGLEFSKEAVEFYDEKMINHEKQDIRDGEIKKIYKELKNRTK